MKLSKQGCRDAAVMHFGICIVLLSASQSVNAKIYVGIFSLYVGEVTKTREGSQRSENKSRKRVGFSVDFTPTVTLSRLFVVVPW